MAVIDIRVMWMRMDEAGVGVPMGVRLAAVPAVRVRMPVVLVMEMRVRVLLGFMRVHVLVPLGEVKPDADGHQQSRPDKLCGDRVALQKDGEHCAEERRHRKIGARPCASKMTQRQHEKHEADAVTEEPDERRGADRTGRWQCESEQRCQGKIHRTGNQPL